VPRVPSKLQVKVDNSVIDSFPTEPNGQALISDVLAAVDTIRKSRPRNALPSSEVGGLNSIAASLSNLNGGVSPIAADLARSSAFHNRAVKAAEGFCCHRVPGKSSSATSQSKGAIFVGKVAIDLQIKAMAAFVSRGQALGPRLLKGLRQFKCLLDPEQCSLVEVGFENNP